MKTPDMLEKYRRSGSSATAAGHDVAVNPKPQGKIAYEPYRISSTEKRYLELICKDGSTNSPSNTMIFNVIADGKESLGFGIMYMNHAMVVEINGRNLKELISAVRSWKVEFIQEFDLSRHLVPEDSSAPFVDKIRIDTPNWHGSPQAPPVNQRH